MNPTRNSRPSERSNSWRCGSVTVLSKSTCRYIDREQDDEWEETDRKVSFVGSDAPESQVERVLGKGSYHDHRLKIISNGACQWTIMGKAATRDDTRLEQNGGA